MQHFWGQNNSLRLGLVRAHACADTHHATPGASLRAKVGSTVWGTMGHTGPGQRQAWGHDTAGGSAQPFSLRVPPAPSCPTCIPWQEHNCVPHKVPPGRSPPSLCTHVAPCMGTRASAGPGTRTHGAEVSVHPPPGRSPRSPVTGFSWGTSTPLPTLREWLGGRVKFIIIILISSPGLTVAAAKENTKA